jgi:hypothetical protein
MVVAAFLWPNPSEHRGYIYREDDGTYQGPG